MLLGFCLRGLSLGMRALYFRVDRSAPRAFLKVPAVRRCIDVAALQARSTPLACCKPGGGHRHRLRHLARLPATGSEQDVIGWLLRDGKQIGTLNTELTLHTAYLWPKEVQ